MIRTGSPNVFINLRRAARLTDRDTDRDMIRTGSKNVHINSHKG
jgi:hypothetical protein